MTDYNKQAQSFLTKTGATIEARLVKTGKHFDEDDENRDPAGETPHDPPAKQPPGGR